MREWLFRLRVPLLFSGLVVLALATMAIDRRRGDENLPWWSGTLLEVAVPIQKMVAIPAEAARDLWSHYIHLVDVRAENGDLRDRLARLEEENLQYREALIASGRLERVAAMRDDLPVPMLPAEVVGQDISPWYRSVLLDRGGNDGVRAGMPVVTDRGVVGLVTAASRNATKTMLLLDGQSAIDGVVQRSRAQGVVRGRGGDRLVFEFVVRGDDVQVGDDILTSGLDAVFPKALRIGTVVEIEPGDSELVKTATLRPAVDFGKLEQVFVMLWRGPAMELLYPGDAAESAAAAGP